MLKELYKNLFFSSLYEFLMHVIGNPFYNIFALSLLLQPRQLLYFLDSSFYHFPFLPVALTVDLRNVTKIMEEKRLTLQFET